MMSEKKKKKNSDINDSYGLGLTESCINKNWKLEYWIDKTEI